VHVKALGHSNERVRDFGEFVVSRQCPLRTRFERRGDRPTNSRQLAQVRNFLNFASLAFVLRIPCECPRRFAWLNADALGINAPERLMILDAFVEARCVMVGSSTSL